MWTTQKSSQKEICSVLVFLGMRSLKKVDVMKRINRIKRQTGIIKNLRRFHGLIHVLNSRLAPSVEVDL